MVAGVAAPVTSRSSPSPRLTDSEEMPAAGHVAWWESTGAQPPAAVTPLVSEIVYVPEASETTTSFVSPALAR